MYCLHRQTLWNVDFRKIYVCWTNGVLLSTNLRTSVSTCFYNCSCWGESSSAAALWQVSTVRTTLSAPPLNSACLHPLKILHSVPLLCPVCLISYACHAYFKYSSVRAKVKRSQRVMYLRVFARFECMSVFVCTSREIYRLFCISRCQATSPHWLLSDLSGGVGWSAGQLQRESDITKGLHLVF